MSTDLMLIKTVAGFEFATDADRESALSWPIGRAVKVPVTLQSKRALKFHQKYWAGLVALTFDYWEPDSGMTTQAEHSLIANFCMTLESIAGENFGAAQWGEMFLSNLGQKRAQKIAAPTKTKKSLHRWIKEQAGYFDIEITPTGIKRALKSINFNSMSEEEFKEFYKAAFTVCWRYVLSSTFQDEAQAENAVNQLLSMN